MIIGVFGLSGSGKTTLIKEFSRNNPQYLCITASDILALSNRPISKAYLNQKILDENQFILIKSFKKLRENHDNILIELHCLIEKSNDTVYLVPKEVLISLNLAYAFLVSKQPNSIREQRRNDSFKKRTISSFKKIEMLAEIQFSYLNNIYQNRLVTINSIKDIEEVIFKSK